MIRIDRVDLDQIAEEYYRLLYNWLFGEEKFDALKGSFSQPADDAQLIRGYNFLCDKMEAALKKQNFVLASPHQNVGYWLVDRLKIRVCPYCNRNYIFTANASGTPKVRAQFDHFLPKKKYPMFALCFYNLIPSCPVCNKLKGEQLVSFNPYQEGFPVNQKFVLSNGEGDLSWVHPTSELKVSLANSDDNLNKTQFLLEQLYQQHADVANDIVMKAQAYNDNYYDGIIQSFQGAGYTKDYINTLIWNTYVNDNQLDKRPLSKFTKDILEQIGII